MSAARPISPRELDRRLKAGDALVLLDVREPDELAICKLAGSVSIPMRELAARAGELDRDSEIVCVCHHGLRSAQVAAWLASAGFDRVHNLSGGLEAWACEIDPWMKRY